VYKGHNADHDEAYRVLAATERMCKERGLAVKTFMATKGDVLVWHGDLLHGGAPIQDTSSSRKSLIAHLMPLGVMPTFFDFSQAGVISYPGGGYTIDVHWRDMVLSPPPLVEHGQGSSDNVVRVIDVCRQLVPLSVRRRVPPTVSAWARKLLDR
jgi:hypothetical protein